MVITCGRWRAVPYNAHCWHLQRLGARKGEPSWEPQEYYPSTVEKAALEVIERGVRDAGGEFDVSGAEGCRALLAEVGRLCRAAVASVAGAAS